MQLLMKNNHPAILLLLILIVSACSSPRWMLTSIEGQKIALDASKEVLADQQFNQFLQPYKMQLDKRMNEVIGLVEQDMRAHKPESLLSNWSADVYLHSASQWLGEPVDAAVVNLGGLRTQLTSGPITVGKVFELMPFENELVILWLKGSDMEELLNFFASIGGQGVGGIRMIIQQEKAVDIMIAGQPIDRGRMYKVATNDYLAEGNDYMTTFTRHTKRVNTGILVRAMLMDYIRKETAQGRSIKSKLEGRIVNAKN